MNIFGNDKKVDKIIEGNQKPQWNVPILKETTNSEDEREDKKYELFRFVERYNALSDNSASRDTLIENFVDKFIFKSKLLELKEECEGLKTDERKVSVFGKGMDSWEARTYDEKKLVNAVIANIIKILNNHIR